LRRNLGREVRIMIFSNDVSKRFLSTGRNGFMNSVVNERKNRFGFIGSNGFNIRGGAVSMSVINWSLRLSSFNISIKINKDTVENNSKIEKAFRQQRACEQAFAFKNNAEAMFHLSNILK